MIILNVGKQGLKQYELLSLYLSIYHGACAAKYFDEKSDEIHGLYVLASELLREKYDIDKSYLMYKDEKELTSEQRIEYFGFVSQLFTLFRKVNECIDMGRYKIML